MDVIINQFDILDYKVYENSTKILNSIIDNECGSGFIVFPELCLTGFPENNVQELWEESKYYFNKIVLESKKIKSTIVIGHIEKKNGFFYNSCFFIKNAEIVHVHRKTRLWSDDIGVFSAGDSYSVVDIDDVCCGAQICFELEFPEGSRALSKKGVQVIFMPNGNMHPYEKTHYILTQARAIENQCFVISCNRVGSGHGGCFVGESLAVSPEGNVICKLGGNEEVVKISLDLNEINKSKNNYSYINLL